MSIDNLSQNEFFLAAVQLADLAAEISSKHFRKHGKITHKKDSSIVTEVDKKIEENLRLWIKQNYPLHGIIGEEFAKQRPKSQYVWVIDPLDGTIAFAYGKPIFATLVALLDEGKPVIGVIDQPIIAERFIAYTGLGAWCNGIRMKTSSVELVKNARLNATTPYMFKLKDEMDKFDCVRSQVSTTGFGVDAYSYGLLANGYIDIIMEANLGFYDVAALRPIVEESGGVITTWDGSPITLETFTGQCLACANPKLHEAVLKIIN